MSALGGMLPPVRLARRALTPSRAPEQHGIFSSHRMLRLKSLPDKTMDAHAERSEETASRNYE
jgi:hypothetical protein